jgi:hypothetical protein
MQSKRCHSARVSGRGDLRVSAPEQLRNTSDEVLSGGPLTGAVTRD